MANFEYWGLDRESSPQTQISTDYLMMNRCSETGMPVLRMYCYPEETIVLGRHQHPSIIREGKSDTIRRYTGGTATLEKPDDLCWAVAFPIAPNGHKNPLAGKTYYGNKVAKSLSYPGFAAVSDPASSTIQINGRVVGGYATCMKEGIALIHGNIVITPFDAEKIDRTIHLRERVVRNITYAEKDAIDRIPALSKRKNGISMTDVAEKLLDSMTGGFYIQNTPNSSAVKELETFHRTDDWVLDGRHVDNVVALGEESFRRMLNRTGHCFYCEVGDDDFAMMASDDFYS